VLPLATKQHTHTRWKIQHRRCNGYSPAGHNKIGKGDEAAVYKKKRVSYSWQPEKERDEKLPGRIASVQQLKLKSAAHGGFFLSLKRCTAFAWLAMYTIKIASGAEQIEAISFSPIKKRPSRASSKLETAAGRLAS
jgi:hypothetical protein